MLRIERVCRVLQGQGKCSRGASKAKTYKEECQGSFKGLAVQRVKASHRILREIFQT